MIELAVSWIIVAGAVYLCAAVSYWFYPVAAVVIANRLLAISLLAHEALHYNLLPSRKWNDFVGRYFCAFPAAMSLSRYRALHQMHHGGLGSERWDPDRQLYDFYPLDGAQYFKTLFLKTLRGQTAFAFFAYYTEFFVKTRARDSDFVPGIIFWMVAFALIAYFGVIPEFLLLYTLPYIFILQPYVLIMGGLQHGPIFDHPENTQRSRTIVGPKWLIELLLPLNINYHGAHHLRPRVPYYHLKQLSEDLKSEGIQLLEEDYATAWRSLFTRGELRERVLAKISYR